jgi:hypothetical protein
MVFDYELESFHDGVWRRYASSNREIDIFPKFERDYARYGSEVRLVYRGRWYWSRPDQQPPTEVVPPVVDIRLPSSTLQFQE